MRTQNKMKRIFTAILAIVIVLSLGTAVFAADSIDTHATDVSAADDVVTDAPTTDTTTDAPTADDVAVIVDHTHTFETFIDFEGKSHYDVCTECAYIGAEYPHTLTIARESYHQWECNDCGRHRVYHYEEDMDVDVKNEFFHIYSCADCGYEYAESHVFATAYNTEYHNEVCVECGYETAPQAHVMVNDYYSNYHDIQCDYCGYMAEHHVGVKYETVDSTYCQAVCRCGVVELVTHDFYDFECDSCGYLMIGTSYGIIDKISVNSDNTYRVRIMINDEIYRFDMFDIDFETGDFVAINHSGSTIHDVTVLIDGDVVDDWQNFQNYISFEVMANFFPMENVTYEDIIIDDLIFHELGAEMTFVSGRVSLGVNNDYIVYDLRDGEMYNLYEGDAVLYISTGEMTYFIVIW